MKILKPTFQNISLMLLFQENEFWCTLWKLFLPLRCPFHFICAFPISISTKKA